MPIYRITKQDRCKILNITEDVHDRAQLLIAESLNVYYEADAERMRLLASGTHNDQLPPLPNILFWYDACRLVDPKASFGKYHYLIDCGHGDAGDMHTMSFSKNVARMLETDIGIVPEFVHKTHHPQDLAALTAAGIAIP